jgi:uncharacterized protein (DUF433 family)
VDLVGGQVESAEASRGASADSGGLDCLMNIDDLIERDPKRGGAMFVFSGTHIPVEFLFEFLDDNQTMETFLDQYPAVSRDHARAVLDASRDLLLTAQS